MRLTGPYSGCAELRDSPSCCDKSGLMGWQLCTKAEAAVQQNWTENHSLTQSLPVWHGSLSGARRCCSRVSPQKIGKPFSFPASCCLPPMTQARSGKSFLPQKQLSCVTTDTPAGTLYARSSELAHTAVLSRRLHNFCSVPAPCRLNGFIATCYLRFALRWSTSRLQPVVKPCC